MAPPVINRLPIISNLLKWFKGDDLTIDNPLFRLHHQASTFVLMFGLLFIFLENHLDGRAIVCQGGDQYARSYCWIHGTAYIRPHLQGKATGCFVDQSKIESPEDAPVTAYYLWLPFLLTFCFAFAKFPRSLWRNFLEGNMIRNIIQDRDPSTISQNFFDFRTRFSRYHLYFGMCEALNLVMVLFSVVMTDGLLLGKFWTYGREVINYIWSVKHVGEDGKYLTHDPMCELFPTEVACYIRIGATTGSIDRSNYLCILSNNLFNQKYFLALWLWWLALAIISVIGIIYRLARIAVPDLSRSILMRRVKAWRLENLELTGVDCFVLDMLAVNIPHNIMDQVLAEIGKKSILKQDYDSVDNHNQTLPLKSTTAL
jgi:hypothetical protein